MEETTRIVLPDSSEEELKRIARRWVDEVETELPMWNAFFDDIRQRKRRYFKTKAHK